MLHDPTQLTLVPPNVALFKNSTISHAGGISGFENIAISRTRANRSRPGAKIRNRELTVSVFGHARPKVTQTFTDGCTGAMWWRSENIARELSELLRYLCLCPGSKPKSKIEDQKTIIED